MQVFLPNMNMISSLTFCWIFFFALSLRLYNILNNAKQSFLIFCLPLYSHLGVGMKHLSFCTGCCICICCRSLHSCWYNDMLSFRWLAPMLATANTLPPTSASHWKLFSNFIENPARHWNSSNSCFPNGTIQTLVNKNLCDSRFPGGF